MDVRSFGKTKNGQGAGLYFLKNSSGMVVAVTDYGATLVSLQVPDINEHLVDVVLGHDSVEEYETGRGSIGATVGRFANRIGNAEFVLNGKTYSLTANDGANTRHGGRDPYSKRMWTVRMPFSKVSSRDIASTYAVESISDGGSNRARNGLREKQITFCLNSPAGDQDFPGNLYVEVTYGLSNNNELHIDYMAVSDADTPLNLTNHSYFNLDGHDSGTILRQFVWMNADRFTPGDEGLLPTGEILPVAGTPMDFTTPKPLGRDIDEPYEQLINAKGYDHNFVVNGEGYREAGWLYSERSGIKMTVLTDLPGVQLYTANGMSGEPGKGEMMYGPQSGVCFETQFWPDCINRENFPGGVLKAGEEFHSRTTYKFTTQ